MTLRKRLIALVGTIVILATAKPCHSFVENIVAAWTFEEGSGGIAHDVSGNRNDGEIIGGVEWDDGKFGKALHFDGSTGYVEVPFDESMRLINQGDFTLAAWFMLDTPPVDTEGMNILQQTDANGTGRVWFRVILGGKAETYLGGGPTTSVDLEIGIQEWYHGAVIVTEAGSPDNIQLYVNGEPTGPLGTRGVEDCEGSFRIGRHKLDRAFWDGIIDDVVMLNRALSEDELRELMDNGISGVMAVEPSVKLAVSWGSVKDATKR